MKTTLTVGLVALLLAGLTGPGLAQTPRQSREDDKNQMKTLGAGLAVSALDALSRGRGGDALLLGAGAAYAGKKYEDARKAQRDERFCDPREYLRDRLETRWERERRERREREERERCEQERRERERWERIQRERREREERERCERERREREERERCERRERWERAHRYDRDRDWDRDRDYRGRDGDRGRR